MRRRQSGQRDDTFFFGLAHSFVRASMVMRKTLQGDATARLGRSADSTIDSHSYKASRLRRSIPAGVSTVTPKELAHSLGVMIFREMLCKLMSFSSRLNPRPARTTDSSKLPAKRSPDKARLKALRFDRKPLKTHKAASRSSPNPATIHQNS